MIIVATEEFRQLLWSCRTQAERTKRTETYVNVIESGDFFMRVKEVHNIFRHMRIYLRKFDSDEARIYHVVRDTTMLEQELKNLPLTEFMTIQRRTEICAVFEARRNGIRREGGGRINAALVQDVHIAAFLLDPVQSPIIDTFYEIRFLKLIGNYLSGSGSEDEQKEMKEKIFFQYKYARSLWDDDLEDPDMRCYMQATRLHPQMWWSRLRTNPRCQDVFEFAMRILSASPSSCAVERTFSLQKRIRTEARNGMGTEKVRKLVYCHWNSRLMDAELEEVGQRNNSFTASAFDSDDDETEGEEEREGGLSELGQPSLVSLQRSRVVCGNEQVLGSRGSGTESLSGIQRLYGGGGGTPSEINGLGVP